MKRTRDARDKYPIQYALAVQKRRKTGDNTRRQNIAAQKAVARNAGFVRKTGAYGLRGPAGIEKKWYDHSVNQTGVPDSGTVVQTINGIAQGTGVSERIGNKITIRNINCRFWFSIDNTSGFIPTTVMRYIIYVDKQCNGAAAAPADLLTGALVGSYRNMDTVDRFQILADKYVVVGPRAYGSTVGGTTFGTDGLTMRKFSWKGALQINFGGTGGTINLIRSNNVGILFIGSPSNANVQGSFRVKYTDD